MTVPRVLAITRVDCIKAQEGDDMSNTPNVKMGS